MARQSRSLYTYIADPHGGPYSYQFSMMVPDAEAADANRGWAAPVTAQDLLPRRLKPRRVHGTDGSGHAASIVIPDPAATIWTDATQTWVVNGVTYTTTGYSGERRSFS